MTLESIHPPERNSLRKNNYFVKEIQFSEGINLTTVVLSAEIIRELAKAESCIILGRCANYLLAGHPNVLRLFIHAPLEARLARVASYSLAWSQWEVARHIRVEDKRRAAYYHYYTGEEWRDTAGYDLSLDSEALGEDGCVELVRRFLPLFLEEL